MGCGRSRPPSPSVQLDHGAQRDSTDSKNSKEKKVSKDAKDSRDVIKDNKNSKDIKSRDSKDVKSRDSKDSKDIKSRDSKDSKDNRAEGRRQSPNISATTKHGTSSTANGATGDGNKSDMQRDKVTNRMGGVAGRDWQFDDPMDAPPETEVAVYRSSVPSSARASLNPAHNPPSPNRFHSNFSLLNGGSHSELDTSTTDQMQMDTQAATSDKMQTHAGPIKSFHVTSSQQEFFKMLDERIEKGADYDSDDY